MTAEKFRRLALEIPRAVESAHMNHPDFRVGGKVFASLGYPDDDHGMVKLAPGQQRACRKKAPQVFGLCAGAWGRAGATTVHLRSATVGPMRVALRAAAGNLKPRKSPYQETHP